MSVNSSSSSDHCFNIQTVVFISIAFNITKILLLVPLCILILYLGYQQWRRQRSFATTRHSDVFTFHMAALELIYASGVTVTFSGMYTGLLEVTIVGVYVSSLVFPGQLCFHTLTCVERYLAVVHPVTYLGMRRSGGVKIRNISLVCVWLLCFGWGGLTVQFYPVPIIPFFCSLVFSLIVITFCSLSVLCVLIRPGPGEVGGERERVDRSKQRAFHTINAIMAVLWLWLSGSLVCVALDNSQLLNYYDGCLVLISANWFILPSSLVLPVLFLHREGKLLCCCKSNE